VSSGEEKPSIAGGTPPSFFFPEQVAFFHGMTKSLHPGAEECRQIIDGQRPSDTQKGMHS